jgi:hypothetical protein
MNRLTVALLAALEALIIAAVGIGVALVPLAVLWGVQFHLGVDFGVFWRAAADIWLLGHGVDLTVTLPASIAAQLGIASAAAPFTISIAALGFAFLVAIAAFRTGVRAADSAYPLTGVLVAIGVYGAIATGVTLTAGAAGAVPVVWQGIVLPVVVFGIGAAAGAAWTEWGELRPDTPRARTIAASVRGGLAATAMVLGAAAALVAVLIAVNYGRIIGLYEGLQSGALGGTVITAGELAFLPNAVVWAASWLIGPGFAIGTGSSVSPLGTELGPIPSIPLLGILPGPQLAIAFAGILVPVLSGFFAARLVRTDPRDGEGSTGRSVLVGVGIGVVAGVALGLVAWWSSGAIGPGRLQTAGPNPWIIGLFAALEVGVAAVLGTVTGGSRR